VPSLYPTIPIPLWEPDPDAVLDLQAALNAIYEEAGYDLSIDYTQPPSAPVFNEVDREWMISKLANYPYTIFI
jgi:hypothetical protein